MFPDITAGAWSAFLAGLIVSPHCVGMCGPLYCSFVPLKKQGSESMQVSYHMGRVLSYTLVGILAGSLSLPFVKAFQWDVSRYFPWVLVTMLILYAVGVDKIFGAKRIATPRFLAKMMGLVRKLPGEVSAFAMGLLTPLLPCAPLYMVLWVALVSGNPFFGAQIMLGFSLGTIPLLWLAQSQYLRNRHKWSGRTIWIVQRSLALVAAIILAARLVFVGAPLEGGACFTM